MIRKPVANADQLVRILSLRLDERSRAASKQTAISSAPKNVEPLPEVAGIGDAVLRRSLIQKILADFFGAELINDYRFQIIIDEVTETLEDDEYGADLLNGLVGDLREAAR